MTNKEARRRIRRPGRVFTGEQENPAQIARRGREDYAMTRHEFGRATEAEFVAEALRRGLVVSRPFDSGPSYDVVVDNGLRLFKVQIKGVTAGRTQTWVNYRNSAYRVSIWSMFRRVPPRFDVCAVYLATEARWVFFNYTVAWKRGMVVVSGGKHTRVGWEIFQPRE